MPDGETADGDALPGDAFLRAGGDHISTRKPRGLRRPDDLPPPGDDEDVPALDAAPEPRGWRSLPLLDRVAELRPLDKREAKESREAMIRSVELYAEHADDAIPLFSRTHKDCQIWSTITTDEATVVADFLIDWARQWAVAAQVVRGIVRTHTYVEFGMITVPRFLQTVRYYIENGFILSFKLGGPAPRAGVQGARAATPAGAMAEGARA